MTCQNYADALNAVSAALLKALIFAGSSIKGRLFQVTMVLGKNENLKISYHKKLAERDGDLEVGFFFL